MNSCELPNITLELLPVDDPSLQPLLEWEKLYQASFQEQTQNEHRADFLRSDTQKLIECAGRAFDLYYKFKESSNNEEEKGSESEPKLEGEKSEKLFSAQWANKRRKMTQGEAAKQSLFKDNYYEILGLENVGLNATDADIKSAYRKLATLYHPDKVNAEAGKVVKEAGGKKEGEGKKLNHDIWMQIQKAYDALSSSASRKQYDSSLPFDDTIPSDSEEINDENFYDTYGKCVTKHRFEPVFIRNAQFSKEQPAPKLGGKTTPIEQVEKFYNFWYLRGKEIVGIISRAGETFPCSMNTTSRRLRAD